MKQEIVIVNERDLDKKLRAIKSDGVNKFHVLSDFDRTVTYGLTGEGKKTATIISQLRSDPKYLGKDYFDEAHKLHSKYYPIEIDPNIPLEEKNEKMHKWWKKHFELLIKKGFSKDLISRVIEEKPLKFRKGTLDFFSFLEKEDIPLIFISAAPGDMLVGYLEVNNLMKPNVYVISNMYEFGKGGKAIKIKEPMIHTFNKTEVVLKGYPIYNKIKNRKNVLLMGDSLGDVGMIEGFPYDNLIKIGFYNDPSEGTVESFKGHYDIVLTGDQDFSYINKLVKEMFV